MSANLITTVEQGLAKAAQDIVSVEKFVMGKVLPILQRAETDAAMVENITGLIIPQAVNIEKCAFAVLGVVIKSIIAAGAAAAAGGLSVSLDAELVADVKSIVPAVKAALSPALVQS